MVVGAISLLIGSGLAVIIVVWKCRKGELFQFEFFFEILNCTNLFLKVLCIHKEDVDEI